MLASAAASKNDRPIVGIIQTPNDQYFDRDTTWDWSLKINGNYLLPWKIDLLFMIDNSSSMTDKQEILAQAVPDFAYARYAELIGLRGIAVDRPDEIGSAWEQALSADRPVLLEARTDPNVPPLPPHLTFEQAKAYASAVLKGDPDSWQMIKQTVKELMA